MSQKKFFDLSLRRRLRIFLESGDQNSSRRVRLIKFAIDIFILIAIIFSCILILFDYYMPSYQELWIECEIFFATFFSIEYLIRWYASENRLKYPLTFFALIDLAAILPSILLISNNFLLLRLFRFARFLRLLKLIRYNQYFYNSINNLKNKYSAFREEYQLDHLGKLFFLSVTALIIGANLVYFTEIEFGTEASPYYDYWESYWNIIIVLISGIEDKEPVSLAGKIEVTVLLIAGICVVGMITAEIVSILVGKFSRKGKPVLKPLNGRMENHIVILGSNSHLDYIIRQLYTAFSGEYYILVVSRKADDLSVTIPYIYKRVVVVEGDPLHPDILKKADIQYARRVIILPEGRSSDKGNLADNRSLMKTLAVSSLNPDARITIQLESDESLKYTDVLENSDFIVSSNYMEKLISQGVLNPGVTEIYRSLMTFSSDSNEFYKIKMPYDFEPGTFNDARKYFFEREQTVIPVGTYEYSWENNTFECRINPMNKALKSKQVSVKPGDYIMIIAYKNLQFEIGEKKRLFNGRLRKEKKLLKKIIPDSATDILSKDFSFKNLKNDFVVICNVNRNLKNIIDELLYGSGNKNLSITLIVQDKKLWDSRPEWHFDKEGERFKTIYGDPSDIRILKKADIEDCAAAVILADPGHGNLADGPSSLVAMAIEKLNPEIHTIMELINSVNREYIDSGIINEVVCLGDVTEKLIAQNCFNPGVITVFDELLTSGKGTPQIFLPDLPKPLQNRTYKEIHLFSIERGDPFIIIGFIKGQRYIINPEFGVEPGVDTRLGESDKLIVISHENYTGEL